MRQSTKLSVPRDIGNLDQMFQTEPIERLCRLCNEWLDIPCTPASILALRLRLFRTGRAYAVQGSDYLFPNDCFDLTPAQSAALGPTASVEVVRSPGVGPVLDETLCECEHEGHHPACNAKGKKKVGRLLYCPSCIKAGHHLANAYEWEENR